MPRRKGQRHAEPFWFSRQKAYYVRIKGHLIRLDSDRDKAWKRYYEIRASECTDHHILTVEVVAAKFMKECKQRMNRGDLSNSQYSLYGRYVSQFCQRYGKMRCADLKGANLRTWLEEQVEKNGWGVSSIAAATKAVKRCFSWAASDDEGGLLKSNPVAGVKTPEPPARNVVVDSDIHTILWKATDEVFRPVLDALQHTGCRPQDICRVTTDHVIEGKIWVLPKHKRERYKKKRIVRLTDHMQQLTAKLLLKREPGQCLFLNRDGNPWRPEAIGDRIERLIKKLGITDRVFPYAYRHTAASNMIMEGVDVVTVAHLLGTSAQVVMRNYGHLLASDEELTRAQEKAIRNKRRKSG